MTQTNYLPNNEDYHKVIVKKWEACLENKASVSDFVRYCKVNNLSPYHRATIALHLKRKSTVFPANFITNLDLYLAHLILQNSKIMMQISVK